MGRGFILFRIEHASLMANVIRHSKELTDEEKQDALEWLSVAAGQKFIIDPQGRDIEVRHEKK